LISKDFAAHSLLTALIEMSWAWFGWLNIFVYMPITWMLRKMIGLLYMY